MDIFLKFDINLFEWINGNWGSAFLDQFFYFFSYFHKFWYVKFIALPLLLIWGWFRVKKLLLQLLLLVGVLVGLCDFLSYRVLKHNYMRLRPNMNPQLVDVRGTKVTPQGYSFPSNHAVNMAALATFLVFYFPKWWLLFGCWTLLTGMSRIYLGVHFPSDVIAGWLLGWMASTLYIGLKINQDFKLKLSNFSSDVV